MATLKAGVIGTGWMGAAHVEAIRSSKRGEVVAIAGSSEEKAKKKAEELGIESAYGNYMDLLKDEDIDVVHGCTPNNLHFPINRAAIAAGKHIISEKPMAMDARESRLLFNAGNRADVVNAVTFNYRHYPAVLKLRDKVAAGELGEIYAIHGCYLVDEFLHNTDFNWRVEPEIGGASRAVADIGSHWFDLAQFVTGLEITEVVADLATFLPVRKKGVTAVGTFGHSATPRLVDVRVTTEDYGSALIRFENGVHGVLTISQVSAGRKNQLYFQIDGSKGSAAWDQERPESPWLGYRDRANAPIKETKATKAEAAALSHLPPGHGKPWVDAVTNFMTEVYQYILDGKKPGRDPANFATFEDGYRAAVIVDRMIISNRQRRWIKTEVT